MRERDGGRTGDFAHGSIEVIETLEEAVDFLFSVPGHGTKLRLPVHMDVEFLRRRMRRKTSVLLSFPPKAAGTFLKKVLERSLESVFLLRGSITPMDQSMNSINYPAWIATLLGEEDGVVLSHVHLTPTETDADLLRIFGIQPVLMCRNILDSLISIHDMTMAQEDDPSFIVEKRGELHQFGSAGPVPDYVKMTDAERKDFLVLNYAPWYMKYYSSWAYIVRRKGLPVVWMTYDQFRRNEVDAVIGMLTELGIQPPDPGRLESVCRDLKADGARSRFKVGLSGRGADFFEERHVAHLRKLASPYGFVDFAGKGLL